MASKGHHALKLKYIGPGYKPTCPCGWTGVPRDRATAEAEYRRHVKTTEAKRIHKNDLGPRPLTPVEDLPDELAPPEEVFSRAVDKAVAEMLERDSPH